MKRYCTLLIILLQCLFLFSFFDIAAAETVLHVDYGFGSWNNSWVYSSDEHGSHQQNISIPNFVVEQIHNDNKFSFGFSIFQLRDFDYLPGGSDEGYTSNFLRYDIKAGYRIREPFYVMLGYFNHSLEIEEGQKARLSGVTLGLEGEWDIMDQYTLKASIGASLFANIASEGIVGADSRYLWTELTLIRPITDDIFVTAGYKYEFFNNNLSSLSMDYNTLKISGLNMGVTMLFK